MKLLTFYLLFSVFLVQLLSSSAAPLGNSIQENGKHTYSISLLKEVIRSLEDDEGSEGYLNSRKGFISTVLNGLAFIPGQMGRMISTKKEPTNVVIQTQPQDPGYYYSRKSSPPFNRRSMIQTIAQNALAGMERQLKHVAKLMDTSPAEPESSQNNVVGHRSSVAYMPPQSPPIYIPHRNPYPLDYPYY